MITQEERTKKLEIAKVIEKDVALSFIDEKSKINVLRSDVNDEGTTTIEFCGGLNGNGKWDDYFESLSNVVKCLNEKYKIWLINIENDCLDDIFYATFGIEKRNE